MSILLEAVLPVFGLVAVGYAAVRLRWLAEDAVRGLSLFVFNFALPAMLFRTLARTDLPERMEWAFLFSFYGAALIVFGFGMTVVRRGYRRPLVGQGLAGLSASYSNTVLLGIPDRSGCPRGRRSRAPVPDRRHPESGPLSTRYGDDRSGTGR